MFLSVILGLASVLQVTPPTPVPAASPHPSPTSQCQVYTKPGFVKYCGIDRELYFVRKGPVQYLDFRKPVTTTVTLVTGSIIDYGVLDEGVTDVPVTIVTFFEPIARTTDTVYLAHPLAINGKTFECASLTWSRFDRMYRICPALPASIVGVSHTVRMSVYPVTMPDGTVVQATDAITSEH